MLEAITIQAIHQFSPSCDRGDGVSYGMFFMRQLLRELGFVSEIFSELIPEGLQNEVRHLSQMQLAENDLLLVHHSLEYLNCAWLNQVKAKKVLINHNIIPIECLPDNELPGLNVSGREQLRLWSADYVAAIGDSEVNAAELRDVGYAKVSTIPLRVDIDRILRTEHDAEYLKRWTGSYNILFVGCFCEQEHQLETIRLLQAVRRQLDSPVRLIMTGGITSDAYLQRVQAAIKQPHLDAHIVVTGKLSDAQLVSLYRSAAVVVSLSAHEGFVMPLIEAMLFDIPVIAKACSGALATMGQGGILMAQDSSIEDYAAQIHLLMTEPALRRELIARQRQNIQRFTRAQIAGELAGFLQTIGIVLPTEHLEKKTATVSADTWQLEGPFDSSYSLAIVNRELARALKNSGCDLVLRSREGHGDFTANAQFLDSNPAIRAMQIDASLSTVSPDVVMRNCYPPKLDDMQGRIKVMHSYGWEETGFPPEYVNEFNQKLDLVTVVSKFVAKVLRDNGVRIPIAVVGNGVDHLLHIQPEAVAPATLASWRSFRFLHVSSCFPRKGADALLAAYGQAFRDTDDVSLIIKTFPNPHNEVEQLVRIWQEKDPEYPHVVVINEDYSDARLCGVYQACHAVVSPSRGEGFGLPVAEAMVFNLPVITTAWSGQLDFADEGNAWMCDYEFTKADSHFGAMHSVWANPDVTHLAQLMKDVLDCPQEQRLGRTSAARRRVLENFSWADVARRTSLAIQALDRQPLLRKKPKIGWISSWNARCGIASYSSFLTTSIPEERLSIFTSYTAERTRRDADNVLRCWDAGMDESMDYAFESIVEQGIGAVVIQYNYGFFSLNTLAGLIQRLKQAEIFVHIFFHATADVTWLGRKMSLSLIATQLALADRLYVHGVDDLNRLKGFGLVDNVVFFPQGLMPTLQRNAAIQDRDNLCVTKRIAAYGFLMPHKGVQALIRAFAMLAENNPHWHLTLVNSLYPHSESERELRECQHLIAHFNLAARVDIHSEYLVDAESQTLLQSADLIVYPYQQTQESSSAAVRMGLAAGRPVAVTPLSIFDDVADAVHLLPGTTPEAIAQGITALLKDDQALATKALQAKTWVATRQWPALSKRLLNVIDGMANELK